MKRNRKLVLSIVVGSLLPLVSSCRPADYEIIKPKQGRSDDGPRTVGTDGEPTDPNGTPPSLDGNVPPTAKVETIWNGRSVTQVFVDQPVTIQPSYDTVDPDDLGKSQCRNPGIIKAEYEIAADDKSANRNQGCETLGIPYTFAIAGEYKIQMIVTSDENETAEASMILRVLPIGEPTQHLSSFTITAEPLLASVGQSIAFQGFCVTKTQNQISWDFADGGQATGRTPTHSYAEQGQFLVKALCTDAEARSLQATLTIVVIDGATPDIPGRPTPTDHEDKPSGEDPGDPHQGKPDQRPGQRPGQGKHKGKC